MHVREVIVLQHVRSQIQDAYRPRVERTGDVGDEVVYLR